MDKNFSLKINSIDVKKVLSVLLLTFSLLLVGCGKSQAEETIYPQYYAMDFIISTYSDFSNHSKSVNDFIGDDGKAVLEFMEDREEILNLERKLTGKDNKPQDYIVKDLQVHKIDDELTEVLSTIQHNYLSDEKPRKMKVNYKILIKGNRDREIIGAMSNDISAQKLLENKSGYDELDLDYQLKDTSEEKPYDLETQKLALEENFK